MSDERQRAEEVPVRAVWPDADGLRQHYAISFENFALRGLHHLFVRLAAEQSKASADE